MTVVAAIAIALTGCSGPADGDPIGAQTPTQTQGPTAEELAHQSFDTAVASCTTANEDFAGALQDANADAKAKSSAVDKPEALTDLKKAITAAKSVEVCSPPTMAADAAAIQQQATDLTQQVSVVQSAARSLRDAAQAVEESIARKKAAVAAAAAAAAQKARTWHMDAGNGYTYDVILTVGKPTTGATDSGHTVGGVCTDFDPSTDLAVPFTATVTSTTKNFDIPELSVAFYTYGFGKVQLLTGGWFIGNPFSATESGTYEAEEYYGSTSDSCWKPAGSLSAGLINVHWGGGLPAGATYTWNFTFIVKGYKSPKHPQGDSRVLSGIGLSPQLFIFLVNGDKVLTLDNKIIKG
jgi:hypothetical protein